MFVIDKTFEFDYGHRVWSQKLNKEYSLDDRCVCRHLHGHRGKVAVHLQGEELDPQGMVTDFKHLNWFKKFIDDVLDHKMILDTDDPSLYRIIEEDVLDYLDDDWTNIRSDRKYVFLNKIFITDTQYYYKLDEDFIAARALNEHDLDLLHGFVLVDFIPTSENLSKWLYQIVKEKMLNMGVETCKIEFNETPKSRSTYTE